MSNNTNKMRIQTYRINHLGGRFHTHRTFKENVFTVAR